MSKLTRRTATAGLVTLGLLGAGIAFAAWTSTGSDSGAATADTAKNLTVVVDDTVTGLYPTGSKDVTFTVKNNNPYPVTLDTATVSNLAVAAPSAGCTIHDVTTSPVSVSDRLAPGATTTATHVVTVNMGADADDACQGKTFTFDLSVSAHSSN